MKWTPRLAAPAAELTVVHQPSVLDRLPAPALVLIAVFGFQLSSVIAKPAIQDAGPVHTAFLRALFGAIVLLAWRRPRLPLERREWLLVLGAGVTMLINTLVMYAAFERIPVGIAVAIGFWGPMTLALLGSHRALDVLWVSLAIGGILLFTPLADASFDSLGVLYAVIAGADSEQRSSSRRASAGLSVASRQPGWRWWSGRSVSPRSASAPACTRS